MEVKKVPVNLRDKESSQVFEQKIIYDLKQENELLRRKLLGKYISTPKNANGNGSSFIPVPTPKNKNIFKFPENVDVGLNENMSKYNIKGRLVDSQINVEEMITWGKENHIPQKHQLDLLTTKELMI